MVLVSVLVLAVLADATNMQGKYQGFRKYEDMCRNVTEVPCFEEDKVVGLMWRIYYAWNMILGNQCMDITFRNASETTILQFRDEMSRLMNTNPNWSNATLLITMHESREMLLIPDNDFPKIGRYLGVPNIFKSGYLGAKLGRVSLYKIALNLFYEGRYLLIGDCENGVVSFLVRRDQKHTWGEITSIVSKFDLKFKDKGYPACKFNMRKKLLRRPKGED